MLIVCRGKSAAASEQIRGRMSPFSICRLDMAGVLILEPVKGKERQFDKEFKALQNSNEVEASFSVYPDD